MSDRPTPETDAAWQADKDTVFRVETSRKLERERNEVREKYDTLAVENMLGVNKICKQRDEAIKELKEAWLAMDEIEGTDRINEWQNKNANIFNTEK